jgi:hypothetical protein
MILHIGFDADGDGSSMNDHGPASGELMQGRAV